MLMILKTMWRVFYIDFLLLMRNAQEWLSALGFFVMVMGLFPLAFSPDPLFLKKYMPDCIWMAALLSSLLSVENIFLTDWESGHFEQLILSETPFSLLMLSKLSAQWLITQFPLVLLVPVLGAFFQLSFSVSVALSLSLLLGTPALTLVGSLGAALTLGLRQQGALLGLLIMPLCIPVLIFGAMVVQQAQAALSTTACLLFLAGLSALVITLLPWAIATVLRMGLED